MDQLPPPFSAKKIQGTPAYKLAREGKPVELKTAKVRIASLEIVALEGAEAVFSNADQRRGICAFSGARTWPDLGCGAHLSKLRRTQAGGFCIEQARTLEELKAAEGDHGSVGGTLYSSSSSAAGNARGDGGYALDEAA